VTTDCAVTDWALDPSDPIDLVSDYNSTLLTVNGATLTCLTEADGLVHVLPGTDVISVKRTAGDFTVRNGAYHASVSGAKQDQWYLRRRNHGGDKTWVYVGVGGAFNTNHIGTDTAVDYWEFHARIFYIRDYAEAVGDGIPTLCVSELVGDGMSSACLLAGVEDMQVEFGIDTSGDGVPNRFDNTPSASDLSAAVVARVSLLLRSIRPLPDYINTKTYRLGQKAIGAKNDGFYRRVMTTTVQTRNTHLPLAR
jgi:type IV pilus assembly protein PilW